MATATRLTPAAAGPFPQAAGQRMSLMLRRRREGTSARLAVGTSGHGRRRPATARLRLTSERSLVRTKLRSPDQR
jgi:hypothetical protein